MGTSGLDSERACPHGAFATQGVARFVAIAVETAEQWRALQRRVPALRDVAGCEPLAERLARKAEIEKLLAEWCVAQEPFAWARTLREDGVPAYVVMRGTDLHRDPQLAHREFFVRLDHPRIGPMLYDGTVSRFSATPPKPTRGGPTIGQDTFEVLSGLLGYSEDEIAGLAAAEVLS
jgi:crotonobetainyl-CoA:carnitine CoA-transferase CaiB-like acyl-CoA transferase